jgi:eukaryotic-like serine/threonine-protein kinase
MIPRPTSPACSEDIAVHLAAGTRLGPYEILSPLGSGGMGDVYAARDTRLDRRVAIKLSKAQFSERFEREARAAAALNHPHICQLYDVGPNYLVMELVEGAPVGPLANVRELLDVATQMADGLGAAHAVGIVHRDIKPSNVLLTSAGQVKILDFGLATISPTAISASAVTQAAVTEAGTTIGTAAYMSPEQARGEALDARTDLWSMGVVLYEMASGTRPFDGPTSAVVFEQLLSKTPTPVRQRNPKIPVELERVISRLLEKDRETRYQSAADVRADVKRIGRDSTASQTATWVLTRDRARRMWTMAAAAIVAVAVLAAALWRAAQPHTPTLGPSSEYVQLTDFPDAVIDPSLSPDGRMVTFIRSDSSFPWIGDVYVKLLSGGEAVRLTQGTARRYSPVFTPDGSRIAYTEVVRAAAGRTATWDTWTVPIGGGQPTRLLPNAAGLVWLDAQNVLFSEIKGTGLHMGIVTASVSRSGQREIYFPEHERAMAHYSYRSPDRQSVLISEMDGAGAFQPCRLMPFDGTSPGRRVGPRGACKAAAWSQDGRWMYFSAEVGGASHLWRQHFPDGQPEQLTFGPGEEFGVSTAADGTFLVTAVGQQRSTIWIHDDNGEHPVPTEGFAFEPHLSADGQRLYYLVQQNSPRATTIELRSMELLSGKTDRLLPDHSVQQFDISGDEREVAFTTKTPAGVSEIWLATLDRSASPRRIAQNADRVWFGGPGLVFRSLENTTNYLTGIRKDGSERRKLLETPIVGESGVSPDGKWAAVFAPSPGTPATVAVSLETGRTKRICQGCQVRWGADGTWLYVTTPILVPDGASLAVPLGRTQEPPDTLDGLLAEAGKGTVPPGTRSMGDATASGRNPSQYAYVRRDMQRNLYRIPIH